MKNTLIVPTDFSENAYTAAKYACDLANTREYAVEFIHYYTTGSAVFDTENTKEEDTPIIKADILMDVLISDMREAYPGLVISGSAKTGLIYEKLPELSKDIDYLMIVMGTTGESKNKSIFWGSTTSAIVSKAVIPVLAIPESCVFARVQTTALLTKFKPEELETLEAFLRIFGSVEDLNMIHVFRANADYDEVHERLNSWKYVAKEMGVVNNVNILSERISEDDVNLDTVPEVVNKLIEDSAPDIVLVTKVRKSFFERLFNQSVSKAIALKLTRPAFFDRIDS